MKSSNRNGNESSMSSTSSNKTTMIIVIVILIAALQENKQFAEMARFRGGMVATFGHPQIFEYCDFNIFKSITYALQ